MTSSFESRREDCAVVKHGAPLWGGRLSRRRFQVVRDADACTRVPPLGFRRHVGRRCAACWFHSGGIVVLLWLCGVGLCCRRGAVVRQHFESDYGRGLPSVFDVSTFGMGEASGSGQSLTAIINKASWLYSQERCVRQPHFNSLTMSWRELSSRASRVIIDKLSSLRPQGARARRFLLFF